MKASEAIREARNVLFERGWCQSELSNFNGEVCLEGACSVALVGTPEWFLHLIDDPLGRTVDRLLREAAGSTPALWYWNDRVGRSFNDVVELLDRAEKIAEQAESDA